MNIVFFGSTSDSVLVLAKLPAKDVKAVVTQPPRPVGRKQVVTPTPVEAWAKEHTITVLSFPSNPDKPSEYANEQGVIDTLQPLKADLLVSASYGQRIPAASVDSARYGGLNVHPSLIPRWRGADPVPWTILSGDRQTGVTIVTISTDFDKGKIIAQKKLPVGPDAETETLRAHLFAEGADLLMEILPGYVSGAVKGTLQHESEASYARRLTRDDGFISWDILVKAMAGEDVAVDSRPKLLSLDKSHISFVIAKAIRALSPWPGIWTRITLKDGIKKRMKILSARVTPVTNILILDTIQMEGKKPQDFSS